MGALIDRKAQDAFARAKYATDPRLPGLFYSSGVFGDHAASTEAAIDELVRSLRPPDRLRVTKTIRQIVRQHSEEALRRIEDRMQLAQEVGRIGCFEIDMRNGTSVGTPAFFELYGLPGDHGSWTQQEWLSFVHQEDHDDVIAHVKEVAQGVKTSTIEYRVVRGDGKVRWTLSRARMETDEDGLPLRAYGIQQDITERKLAELALAESELLHRSILEASSDCINLIGLDGRLELINGPGACAMEIDDVRQVIGRDWIGLWPTKARKAATTGFEEAGAGKASRFTDYCPTAKGTPRWWDVGSGPINGIPLTLMT